MTSNYLEITGIDPIVARDGRPFGDGTGNRMRGLPWPLPSAVAGSARRAFVIQQTKGQFDTRTIDEILSIEVAGLFPMLEGKLYLPAPKNCVWSRSKSSDNLYRASPGIEDSDSGCDLPEGLRPVMLENPPEEDFKPETLPAWWPVEELAKWLVGEPIGSGKTMFCNGRYLKAAGSVLRERIAVLPETGAAEESKLFAVSDLTISHLSPFGCENDAINRPRSITLSCRVKSHPLTQSLNLCHPLGGNRRLAHWQTSTMPIGWRCPERVRTELKEATHVCMMLTTPALFDKGYMPCWLTNGTGRPPGVNGVTLKLVGILSDRWKALSRFALDPRNRGPQPLRRMVPAGGVYFFEVQEGCAEHLADRWLESVSDREQDRLDGFGLAVWGTWNSTQEKR